MKKDVYQYFIDYAKIKKIQHKYVFQMFGKLDIFGKYIIIIKNLYLEEIAAIRIEKGILFTKQKQA